MKVYAWSAMYLALSLFVWTAQAQPSVQLTIDSTAQGTPIPSDFAGLSFELSNLIPDKEGVYQFSADNKALVAWFRAIGIKNLRVGGGTADDSRYRLPTTADIDQLFGFARAADVKVIYTFRLLNGDKTYAADMARYIYQRYRKQLSCFEIGNEPDWHSFHTSPGHDRDPLIVESAPEVSGSAYPSYLHDWNEFAAAILKAAPGAPLTGPDTGSDYPLPGTKDTDYDGESWTQRFAEDEAGLKSLVFVTHYDYPGQGATGVTVATAIDSVLSADGVSKRYPLLYDHVFAPILARGLS